MSSHVVAVKTYLIIFGLLLGLTALTTLAAYQDMGSLNTPVALLIASVKMILVVLWFMHLRSSGKLIWIFALAGLLWFLILIAFTLSDFNTRVPVTPWTS